MNVDLSFTDFMPNINDRVNIWCNKFSKIAGKHAPID